NAVDEHFCVLHLAERFRVMLGPELEEAPILAHLGLAEILIDRGQFDGQRAIQEFDDFGLAFHSENSPNGGQPIVYEAAAAGTGYPSRFLAGFPIVMMLASPAGWREVRPCLL